jgi:protein CpxP
MKKWMMFAMALAFFGGTPAFAHERGMDTGKRVEKMTKELGLSAEQQTTVKGILDDYKVKMEALQKEKHEKIDAVLTPEQKKKHEEEEQEEHKKDGKEKDEKED